MAEREGFEPPVPLWGTLTFQASTFGHSVTPPFGKREDLGKECSLGNKKSRKNRVSGSGPCLVQLMVVGPEGPCQVGFLDGLGDKVTHTGRLTGLTVLGGGRGSHGNNIGM